MSGANVVGIIVACAIGVVGCSKVDSFSPAAHTLIIGVKSDPRALNPLYLDGSTAQRIGGIGFSFLTHYDPHGNQMPEVAMQVPSVENGGVSGGGTVITYHLRKDVRWQDGEALTSRDVLFTYRAIMSSANAVPSRTGYDHVASVEAPDPYTVVVRLKRPFYPIVSEFFGGDSNQTILPAHLLARFKSLDHVAYNAAPIGSGPFVFTRWRHDDRIDAVANKRYFLGRPALDSVVLRTIHNSSTMVTQLATHEVNATLGADVSDLAALRALRGYRVLVTPFNGFLYISFNQQNPVTSDLAVRRAYALAIDLSALVSKVTQGAYLADTGLRGLFTWAYDPSAGNIPYDPRRAATILTKDGWLPGPDGIRVRNGQRLELQLAVTAGRRSEGELAVLIAAEERAIGIDVSIKSYSFEQMYAQDGPLYGGRYQVALASDISYYNGDAAWFVACDQRAQNGFHVARYCNAAVDRALDRAESSFDRATQVRAYAFVQRQLLKDLPFYIICQQTEIDVIPSNLVGFEPSLSATPFTTVARWRFR